MGFCPLLSTDNKKVECNKECEWYEYDKDPHNFEGECCIIKIAENLSKIKNENY